MCIAFELGNIKLVTLFAVSKECLRGGIGVLECVTLGSTGKKCGTQANYMEHRVSEIKILLCAVAFFVRCDVI